MSKDPAFLFYVNDYLGGTMGFTIEMHGAYLLMLLYQFNNGPFEESAAKIIGENWEKIKCKFKKTDSGLFYNERLKIEIEKRRSYSASRSKNIGGRWDKNNKPLSGKKIDSIHMNNICNTHVIHMGNGNEDKEEGVGETKPDTWRTSFAVYKKMVLDAEIEILADEKELGKQREFNPGVDVRKSISKAVYNFWGTDAGWKHKKKSKAKFIDMRATLINAIGMSGNKVYLPKVDAKPNPGEYTPSYYKKI